MISHILNNFQAKNVSFIYIYIYIDIFRCENGLNFQYRILIVKFSLRNIDTVFVHAKIDASQYSTQDVSQK